MQTSEELKSIVREKYSKIAEQDIAVNQSSCCGAGGFSNEVYNIMTDDYTGMQGYAQEADLGLGCGLPTQFAKIQKGDTVIDLGSGAGNDCFLARHETGETGKVIGVDFADVIVSNCVLNLVPNKQNVIKEIYRVLKPGGHFSISDIVLVGDLPKALQEDAEMYAGCVAGAIQKDEYLGYISEMGFENITVQKEKAIVIPNDILSKYLSSAEINAFNNGQTGIFSATVFAQKPGKSVKIAVVTMDKLPANACAPGSGCC